MLNRALLSVAVFSATAVPFPTAIHLYVFTYSDNSGTREVPLSLGRKKESGYLNHMKALYTS